LTILRRAIAEALTDRQREALLAKLAGVPLMEVARRLSTTQGAIYKLLHDARRRIKQYIQAAEPDTVARMAARGGT
jgi:RNA polymerase sigma-70 factor, ECF subfamily